MADLLLANDKLPTVGSIFPPGCDTCYLSRRSKFGTDSTIKDTLRRRLRNLLERELLDRSGTQYTISDAGLAYLGRTGDEDASGGDEIQEIRKLVRQQEASVRESIRDILADLDPFAFEHLVKRLLEEMSYDNVDVTSRSGDGGVDVVADIELGITSVREVDQAKRHRRTIQRKDLDALRGSLHRFGAVRGTIIATSKYSKVSLRRACTSPARASRSGGAGVGPRAYEAARRCRWRLR